MSNFEAQLAISAMSREDKPETSVTFAQAVRAYTEHCLPKETPQPTNKAERVILYGEILPPEPSYKKASREPTRQELLQEMAKIAGWTPGATPLINKLLIQPDELWENDRTQRARTFGMK